MRLSWKIARFVPLALVLVAGTGCGGIMASQSISPATFLLPGLIQATPPPPADLPVPQLDLTNTVAQVRRN